MFEVQLLEGHTICHLGSNVDRRSPISTKNCTLFFYLFGSNSFLNIIIFIHLKIHSAG